MKIGILGTGIVGTTLGSHFVAKSHQVILGSRNGTSENGVKWLKETGERASLGTYSTAASFGDIVFNCTMGIASLTALQMAGANQLKNKILIDVANPIDFSLGMPPRLTICNDNSLAEQIQRMLPQTRVVKALNTVNYEVMVNPQKINNKNIDVFICGNDTEAKETLTELLIKEMSWHRENILDLGGLIHARSTEAMLLFFLSLATKYGSFYNGIKVYSA